MTWQAELAVRALRAAERAPGVAEVALAGSLADGRGVDDWSDVDLHVRLADGGPARFDPAGWAAQLGGVWALTCQHSPRGLVVRVVYDDGRRLDVVVDGAGGGGGAAGAAGSDAAELMEFRHAAALAVVKLARDDLLIGAHLALGLVQRCLVLAMLLRDRQLGTAHHRVGGPFNDVVARLDRLRRHPWTAAGLLELVREAAEAYDELAVELDPAHVADRSGLEALLRQARR